MNTDLQVTSQGYKFETLATLPKTWAETSREYIEERENHVVNNKAQYCSVVRTGIGKTVMCLGGEVDASKCQPHSQSPCQPGEEITTNKRQSDMDLTDASKNG